MSDHGEPIESESRPRSAVGELQDMIDEMIAHLEEAKSMPLSTNVLVDKELFLTMLHRLRSVRAAG